MIVESSVTIIASSSAAASAATIVAAVFSVEVKKVKLVLTTAALVRNVPELMFEQVNKEETVGLDPGKIGLITTEQNARASVLAFSRLGAA